MPSLNKVMLIGHIVRDPQMKSGINGSNFCDLELAMSRVFKTQDGQEREDTTFVTAVASSRLAVVCSQMLHKGSRVYVEGRLFQTSWTDKATNAKRNRLKVAAERVLFLSPKDNQMHDVTDNLGEDISLNFPNAKDAPQNPPGAAPSASRASAPTQSPPPSPQTFRNWPPRR